MDFLQYFFVLLGSMPAIALWIAVIVFGAIMLQRGGGRAERLLIAGGGIKLACNLLVIPSVFFGPWLFHQGYTQDYISAINTFYGFFRDIVSMAGILCLVFAFWVKSKPGEAGIL